MRTAPVYISNNSNNIERADIVSFVRKMRPPCLDLTDNTSILTRSEKVKWKVILRKTKIELQVYDIYKITS